MQADGDGGAVLGRHHREDGAADVARRLCDRVLRARVERDPQRGGPDLGDPRRDVADLAGVDRADDQTQSVTALKKTVWPGATARVATTQAAMSIQLIMWPPCMTPRVFSWPGITRIERT